MCHSNFVIVFWYTCVRGCVWVCMKDVYVCVDVYYSKYCDDVGMFRISKYARGVVVGVHGEVSRRRRIPDRSDVCWNLVGTRRIGDSVSVVIDGGCVFTGV